MDSIIVYSYPWIDGKCIGWPSIFFFKLTQNILNWNILLQVYSQRFRKVNHLTKVNEVAISLPHSHLHLLFNTLDLVLTISLIVDRAQDKPDTLKESCSLAVRECCVVLRMH